MRARGVTTPLLTATASSSIDLNTVSSPGESSIRYMPDLMRCRGFERTVEVLRMQIPRNFRARVQCTFVHVVLAAEPSCNGCYRLRNLVLIGRYLRLVLARPGDACSCSLPRRQRTGAFSMIETSQWRSGKLP